MAQTIIDQFGRLDGVLHNASILGHLSAFKDIDAQEWQDVMQINLNGMVYMTQALIPALEKASKASVVFTTSSVGRKGRAFWGTYAVSKFATEGVMQTLADEYQKKLRQSGHPQAMPPSTNSSTQCVAYRAPTRRVISCFVSCSRSTALGS